MSDFQTSFELIALLSRNTSESSQSAYEALLLKVKEALYPFIESSSYIEKSALVHSFDETLESARLFQRYSFLYGKTCIGVVGPSRSPLSQMLSLSGDRQTISLLEKTDNVIKIVCKHTPDQQSILATNTTHNTVRMTPEQYSAAVEMKSQGIELSDLIISAVFPVNTTLSEDCCFILFPSQKPVQPSGSAEYDLLASLCEAMIIAAPGDQRFDIPDAVSRYYLPVWGVQDSYSEAGKKFARLTKECEDCETCSVLPNQVGQVVSPVLKVRDNCIINEKCRLLLNRLSSFYENRISQSKTLLEKLSDTLLHAEDIANTVEGIRQEEAAKLSQLKDEFNQFLSIQKEVLMQSAAFEESLKAASSDRVRSAVNLPCAKYILPVYDELIEYVVERKNSVELSNYIRSIAYTDRLRSKVYALYLNEVMHSPLDTFALLDLASSTKHEDFIRKAQVHFCDALHMPPQWRNTIAAKIRRKSPFEMYCAAEYQGNGSVSKEVEGLYQAAAEAGCAEADDRLARHYVATEQYSDLKACADRMNPTAMYEYGRYRYGQVSKKAEGIRYLRIASVLGSESAMRYYAQLLYCEAVGGDPSDRKAKIDAALALYEKLSNGNMQMFAENKGVLYYLQSRYQEAYNCLSGKTLASGKAYYALGDLYEVGYSTVYPDLQKAQEAFERATDIPGYEAASIRLARVKRKLEAKQAQAASPTYYQSTRTYSSTTTNPSSYRSGCFITTATCTALGKPLDCEELVEFCHYRDNVLLETPEGMALAREYYRIAPDIVDRIDREENSREIYCSLYNTYIRSGFELLREGNEAEAKQVYIRMVQLLASKYDISIDPQIASQIGQGKA